MKCRKCHGVTPPSFHIKRCTKGSPWRYDEVRRAAARDDRNLPMPHPIKPAPAKRRRKGGVG